MSRILLAGPGAGAGTGIRGRARLGAGPGRGGDSSVGWAALRCKQRQLLAALEAGAFELH